MTQRILVMRLGALGDLTLCFGAFSALRRAHREARIALMTGPSFGDFAKLMPWFDTVLIDPRPSALELGKWRQLVKDVKAFAPTRVYDFQGKTRQSVLYAALGGPLWGPEWSGAAPWCSHPRLWPAREGMHYTDFLAAQLERAGLVLDDAPELSWLDAPMGYAGVPERFALFVPGCAPQHPHKRWPVEKYAALSKILSAQGLTCIAVGTTADQPVIDDLRALAPEIVDLSGKTTLPQLGGLARRAACVIGNDTGPTHIAAAVGARVVALMSDKVNPVWSAPKGPKALWLQGTPLATLEVQNVLDKIKGLIN